MELKEKYEFLEKIKSDPICIKMYDLGKSMGDSVFLYKLRRKESASSDERFFGMKNYEDLKQAQKNGIIYAPNNDHTWNSNLSWLLGLVHRKRDVRIYSEIIARNIWRKDFIPSNDEDMKTTEFSAFAREIAAVMKVGYELKMGDDFFIYLKCNNNISTEKLNISDINPTKEEIKMYLSKVIFFIFSQIKENFSGIKDHSHYSALSSYIEYCESIYDKEDDDSDVDSKNRTFSDRCNFWLGDFFEESNIEKTPFLILVEFISDFSDHGFIYTKRGIGPKVIEDFKNTRNLYDEKNNLSSVTSKYENLST